MDFGPLELAIILVIVLVLFGAKRLPDMARSLGRSARILKAETKGLRDDDTPPAALEQPVARFDPVTGEPLARFDPYTGKPLAGQQAEGQPGTTDRP